LVENYEFDSNHSDFCAKMPGLNVLDLNSYLAQISLNLKNSDF